MGRHRGRRYDSDCVTNAIVVALPMIDDDHVRVYNSIDFGDRELGSFRDLDEDHVVLDSVSESDLELATELTSCSLFVINHLNNISFTRGCIGTH